MSCWVAPSIAAELWGISLEQVMGKARRGEIPSCTEHGFFLIDLSPELPEAPPPETFVAISEQELAALSEPSDPPAEQQPARSPADSLDEESASIENWREIRRKMGRMRVPPPHLPPPPQAQSAAA